MRFSLFFLLFLHQLSSVYSQFSDNFSDGNFTSSPAWVGNTFDFTVNSGELQLNAPAVSGYKYLSTNSQSINNATWEFQVRMTFGTSSSNFAKVYLTSNTLDLSGALNGYYVLLGGTNDDVSLYRQTGTTSSQLIDGRDGAIGGATVDVRVRVTRTTAGLWEVLTDTSSVLLSEGTAIDITHPQSLFFGVGCNFTSTRSTRFYFDDFVVTGNAAVDTTKPTLDSVRVISNSQLELVFSEPVDPSTSQLIANYSANNGLGTPLTAVQNSTNFNKVTLSFSSSFSLGTINTLSVNNVTDISGNSLTSTNKNFVYFLPATAQYRDVVINEIFADPTPIVGLPDGEFVELYNPTNKYYNLDNWTLSDGSSTATLGNYILAPDSFLLLVSNSSLSDFSSYANKIGLSSFPGLNNLGETLTLINNNGTVIDAVEYSDKFYQDEVKKEGGFSLEQINSRAKCFNQSNWTASQNPSGGTPGSINSIWDTTRDSSFPRIVSCIASSNTRVLIQFSKTIDTSLFLRNIQLSGGLTIVSLMATNLFSSELELVISPSLDTGRLYKLSLDSLRDCEGNIAKTETEFVLAHANTNGAIVINELLFNPYSGEDDFVELYNNSELFLDLKNWQLGNEENGMAGNLISIPIHYVIKPKEYVVITKDYSVVTNRYKTHSSDHFIEIESLPSYPNEEGTVYLLLPSGSESDKFSYSEEFHFALLRDVEGVSLERVNFQLPTQESSNWHSAAEEVGFATPGVKNSQFTKRSETFNILSISPEIFSPDNDGFEDLLTLNYTMPEVGYVGNITIYDSQGRLTKTLIQNQLLAKTGSFTWDGVTEDNTKARVGRYVILFEYFNLEGTVKIEKTTCVVGHRL